MTAARSFEEERKAYCPRVPPVLKKALCCFLEKDRAAVVDHDIQKLLPSLTDNTVYKIVSSSKPHPQQELRVGVVFSGGPAPGGHSVIAGLYDALHEGNAKNVLIGFKGGLKGVLRNSFQVLDAPVIDETRNTGGFSLLGTGRTSIEKDEDIDVAIQTLKAHKIDALVCIGGDDSNTDAAILSNALLKRGEIIRVIGVPKTIDGDLQSQDIPISFGFDTACKTYAHTIGNIAKDCLSSKKQYFFIRLMGRVASHITLECTLQIHPNIALISEEIAAQEMTLADVVQEIASLVEERYQKGLHYGVVLIPEGLIEQMVDVRQLVFELNDLLTESGSIALLKPDERLQYIQKRLSMPSRECILRFPEIIQAQLIADRDPHGNVQVSKIETAHLVADLVHEELVRRSIPFSFQTAFCGYEGRSAYPSNFDCTYCYALGRLSAVLSSHDKTGFMAAIRHLDRSVDEWEPVAVPLISLLHFEQRGKQLKPVIKKTLVDLSGKLFHQFAKMRSRWRLEDSYLQPPPLQFFGPEKYSFFPCRTVNKKE